MGTYSFLNTNCALTGPGGSIDLGAGASVAEEGIGIDVNDDINNMVVGADGKVMHSLGANKSGTISVRLLKTSPTNQKLSAMYAFQTQSAENHGKNTISLANSITNDSITCQFVAFKRRPAISYAKNGDIIEWMFDAGVIDITLGGNV